MFFCVFFVFFWYAHHTYALCAYQKNTKRHAHEEKHKKICASTFVFLYAHDIKKTHKKHAHNTIMRIMRIMRMMRIL